MFRPQHGQAQCEQLQRQFSQMQLSSSGKRLTENQNSNQVNTSAASTIWHLAFKDTGFDAVAYFVHNNSVDSAENVSLDWSTMDVNPYFYGGDYDDHSENVSENQFELAGLRRCMAGGDHGIDIKGGARVFGNSNAMQAQEHTRSKEFEINLEESGDEDEDTAMVCGS